MVCHIIYSSKEGELADDGGWAIHVDVVCSSRENKFVNSKLVHFFLRGWWEEAWHPFLHRGQRSEVIVSVCPVVRCCTSTDRLDRLNITMFLKEFSFSLYSWVPPHCVPCVPALLFMYFRYLLGLFVVFCWTTVVGIILCSTPFYLDFQLPLDILCCLACLCYQHEVVVCSLYFIMCPMSVFESSTQKCEN